MAKRFTRNIENVNNIKELPLDLTLQNDLVSDKQDVYVRNKEGYHCLTDNVKDINGFKPESGSNSLSLIYVEDITSKDESIIIKGNGEDNTQVDLSIDMEKIENALAPLLQGESNIYYQVNNGYLIVYVNGKTDNILYIYDESMASKEWFIEPQYETTLDKTFYQYSIPTTGIELQNYVVQLIDKNDKENQTKNFNWMMRLGNVCFVYEDNVLDMINQSEQRTRVAIDDLQLQIDQINERLTALENK